jgi:hypothetical protein
MATEVKRRAETLREFAQSFGISYDSAWRHSKDGSLRTISLGGAQVRPPFRNRKGQPRRSPGGEAEQEVARPGRWKARQGDGRA